MKDYLCSGRSKGLCGRRAIARGPPQRELQACQRVRAQASARTHTQYSATEPAPSPTCKRPALATAIRRASICSRIMRLVGCSMAAPRLSWKAWGERTEKGPEGA